MGEELVSIITPCYNGEKYLHDYFDSVLKQSYKKIELIFVDDGSTDSTKDIALYYEKEFKKNGIDFIYIFQENKGQASAINQGLKIFKGQYLTWFDSDDIMLSNCIEVKVDYLRKNLDYGFVLCDGVVVNELDIEKHQKILHRNHSLVKDDLFRDLINVANVVFCPGTIMVRRDAIIKAIPSLQIYESRCGQNLQLMLPLAYSCKWGYIDKILFKYVIHGDSHSHKKISYENMIAKNLEYEETVINTILKIPRISDDELHKWVNITKIKYCRDNLRKAFYFHKKSDVKKYRQILSTFGKLKFMDFYFGFIITNMLDVVRHQLWKFETFLSK